MLTRPTFFRIVCVLAISALAACRGVAQPESPTTRPACRAGSWYPGDAEVLARLVDDLLSKARPPEVPGKPLAVIAPHAGYPYSAAVAAAAYRALQGHSYHRVIILAFSHAYAGSYKGVAVPAEWSAYQTPLGSVPVDREAIDKLAGSKPFFSRPGVDRDEHSLELQLPFLQRTLKSFRLVPMMVGRMSPPDYAEAAKAICPLVDGETLLVVSSDFTHFGPMHAHVPFTDHVEKNLNARADEAAAPLLKCDFDGFAAYLDRTGDTICGHNPILLLLRILSMGGGAGAVRAGFDTSGHITGEWSNSVTYQSFVFTRRVPQLDEASRRELLRIARETVRTFTREHKMPQIDADKLPAVLREDARCFVTLTNQGELRGCIGNPQEAVPFFRAVMENAVRACQDFRFAPVAARELDDLHIEISWLTPLKPLKGVDEIIVGRDGLVIEMGMRAGLLLPQVAYERGWTREEFLGQVCLKAGLPPDAWRKPDAKLYSFEAEVFGEPTATSQPS